MSAEGSSLESIVEPEGLIRFLKHPCWTGSIVHPTAGSFIILLIVYFLLTIPLSFLAQVVSAALDLSKSATELDWTQRVIRGILLGPLVEELLFRLIYVFTRRNLAVIIGTSLVLLLVFLFRKLCKSRTVRYCYSLWQHTASHFRKEQTNILWSFPILFLSIGRGICLDAPV